MHGRLNVKKVWAEIHSCPCLKHCFYCTNRKCSDAHSVPNMAKICQEIWKFQVQINFWPPEKCKCPRPYLHGTQSNSANLY